MQGLERPSWDIAWYPGVSQKPDKTQGSAENKTNLDTLRDSGRSVKVRPDTDMLPSRHFRDVHDVIDDVFYRGLFGVLVPQEEGYRRHHHHTTILLQSTEDVVGNISAHGVHPICPRVREDYGRLSNVQDVAHGIRRHVRDVHQHAEAVHLLD